MTMRSAGHIIQSSLLIKNMANKGLKISGKDVRKQIEAAKLEVSRQLYAELAIKFAKSKAHGIA